MDTIQIDDTIRQTQMTYHDRPPLNPLGELAVEVLKIQRDVLQSIDPDLPTPDETTIRQRLSGGLPALWFHDLHIDEDDYRSFWYRVVEMFSERGALTSQEAEGLSAEADTTERLMRVTEPWYEHGADESISLHSDLTPEMVSISVKPWMLAAASRVSSQVSAFDWAQSYCPACGGEPDLGIFDPNGQQALLCSRCDTTWSWQSDSCPFCDDGSAGSEYHEGTVPGHRLRVCKECNSALKVVDQSKVETALTPSAERIFALDLDRVASELNITL